MSRVNVLDFHGNGSIVEVESYKHHALMSGSGLLALGPGAKPQAPSVRQIDARQYVLLTQAPSTKLQATSIKQPD